MSTHYLLLGISDFSNLFCRKSSLSFTFFNLTFYVRPEHHLVSILLTTLNWHFCREDILIVVLHFLVDQLKQSHYILIRFIFVNCFCIFMETYLKSLSIHYHFQIDKTKIADSIWLKNTSRVLLKTR